MIRTRFPETEGNKTFFLKIIADEGEHFGSEAYICCRGGKSSVLLGPFQRESVDCRTFEEIEAVAIEKKAELRGHPEEDLFTQELGGILDAAWKHFKVHNGKFLPPFEMSRQ